MALEQNLNLTCRIRSNSNSNFKRPYLGNETTNLISAGAKILLSSRAFTCSFMKVGSRHSFTLFQSEKPVPGVSRCVSLDGGKQIFTAYPQKVAFSDWKRPKEGERVALGHFHERVGESPRREKNFGTSGYKIRRFVSEIWPFEVGIAVRTNSTCKI